MVSFTTNRNLSKQYSKINLNYPFIYKQIVNKKNYDNKYSKSSENFYNPNKPFLNSNRYNDNNRIKTPFKIKTYI